MLLRSVRIVDLVHGTASEPRDLWISDGRLAREREASPGAVIDLSDRFVIPGLWDAHIHFGQWAAQSQRLDLTAANSPEDAVAALQSRLDHSDGPVLGWGLRDGGWPTQATADRPDDLTGQLLDELSPTRPIVVCAYDMHSVWSNTAGLRHFGMADHKAGRLREHDAFTMQERMGDVPEAQLDDWVFAAAKAGASRGVVGILDMETTWSVPHWRRRMDDGFGLLRVMASTWPADLSAAIRLGMHDGLALHPSGLLTAGPLKILFDGTLSARTAWCQEDYAEPLSPEYPRGYPNFSTAELLSMMDQATHAGLAVTVHAIGDLAAETVIAAFAETGAHGGLEHAQLVSADDVAAMARLGLWASVQPMQMIEDRDVLDRQWAGRTDRAFAFRTLLEGGVALRLGSDAPVTAMNPWQAIQAAVARTMDDRPPWHPEQQLTLSQALLSSTNQVSALVNGGRADLVVLDQNPFEVPTQELGAMPVYLTMVDGKVTHQA